jgi:hypothetical protein
VLLPLAGCLAACVSIPESGSVATRSAEAHAQRAQGYIHALASAAKPGMSPEQVALGFLQAQVDSDHHAALSYLTPGEAGRWNPSAQVTVFGDENPPTLKAPAEASGTAWSFSAPKEGVISQAGDFTATPNAKARGILRMTRVAGEWRIDSAPDGLYLSPADFARNYVVYDTYFVDPSSRLLVPNPIYLPVGEPPTTPLVRALLAGPTPWLQAAVRTAFPTGSALRGGTAPVRGNVVQVDLTRDVLDASAADVHLMGAQLAWTLGQLDDVNAVRVTVDNVPLAGLGPQIDTKAFAAFDPSAAPIVPAVAVVANRVVSLNKTVVNLPGEFGLGAVRLIEPAISALGDRAAALDPTKTKLYVGNVRDGAPISVRLQGQHLTAPSFDPFGNIWEAGIGPDGSTIWMAPSDGTGPVTVAVPELAGRTVQALRIARDGVRVALVLADVHGGSRNLFIGHIVRNGIFVALDGLHRVESVLSDVAGISWANADDILVLGDQQAYLVEPFGVVVPTGAQLKNITGVITGITAAPQQVILASTCPKQAKPVLTCPRGGRIWSTDGTSDWVPVRAVRAGVNGKDPSYPG